jgi:hypothetical protein
MGVNPLLDKQIKEINKQKEFLLKLQSDKEALERQMRDNEAVMVMRMQKVAEEKAMMELENLKLKQQNELFM